MDNYQNIGCDECCPANLYSEAAIHYQNLGCLPTPFEITKMIDYKYEPSIPRKKQTFIEWLFLP